MPSDDDTLKSYGRFGRFYKAADRFLGVSNMYGTDGKTHLNTYNDNSRLHPVCDPDVDVLVLIEPLADRLRTNLYWGNALDCPVCKALLVLAHRI